MEIIVTAILTVFAIAVIGGAVLLWTVRREERNAIRRPSRHDDTYGKSETAKQRESDGFYL